jgi:predicted outer membrane protein
MKTLRGVLILIAGLVAITGANGQQPPTDPYNPQTRRTTGPTPVEPSLADMGFGTDQGNIGPFVTNTDKQYAQAMALRGLMEIRLGQTALDKTSREDVKAIAQRMVKDYLNWNDGMTKAAKKLGIALPTAIEGKEKDEVERICALTGPAFDEAYLKEVVRLQTKALTMSHHEASEAAVSGFRHWAGVVIPNLQDQVHIAQVALKAK